MAALTGLYIHGRRSIEHFCLRENFYREQSVRRVLTQGAPGKDWQLDGKVVKPEILHIASNDVLI